jgi:hypothetical protein
LAGLAQVATLVARPGRVLPEATVPSLPLRNTAHRELRGTLRLRVAFSALGEALAAP